MQLREIQKQFCDMILHAQPQEGLNACFNPGDIPLNERYSAYQNNVYLKLTDVLSQTFSTVTALVGDDFMTQLCGAYIRQHPPQTGCINHYGEDHFPRFIDAFEPAKPLPYLGDIARLDAGANRAVFMRPAPLLQPSDLPQLFANPDQARLSLNDDVSLIPSKYPVLSLRDYCRGPQQGDFDMGGAAEHTLVKLKDKSVSMIAIAEDAMHFMLNCQVGLTVPQAIESTLSDHADFQLEPFLHFFIPLGVFKQ